MGLLSVQSVCPCYFCYCVGGSGKLTVAGIVADVGSIVLGCGDNSCSGLGCLVGLLS